MGVNIYQGKYVRAGANGQPELVPFPPGKPSSSYDWNVTPEVLYWGPRLLYERYALPMYTTENGLALFEWPSDDGKVHDAQRIDFLQRYLHHLKRACAEDIPVKGYFHWALTDNLEWADGFRQRFGRVYVDFATQRRVLKDSASWYRDMIAQRGASV